MNETSQTAWPDLPYAAWRNTYETLHLWTQIVGKIRLELTPWLNHSWHVTFYVTARGLTTSTMPLDGRDLEIEFDFIDHVLWLRTSDGHVRQIVLHPITVAEFYGEVMHALSQLGVTVRIDLTAADLPGKIALVAAHHAIALIPGVLTSALRTDVTTVALVDPPTRGIYAITPGTQRFVVNLAPEESRLTPLAPDRFASLGVPLRKAARAVTPDAAKREAQAQAAELESRQKLWRWLLLAALGVLLLETLIAGKLSRTTAVQTEATP